MNHESWLEKHWIRGYNFEIIRSEVSWNTARCCFMIRLFLNNIYLFFFERRLVFLGFFSLRLHFSPLFFFLFIFKNGKVTYLRSLFLEWEGAQVTWRVVWDDFSFAVSVLKCPPVPVVVDSGLAYFLPTPIFSYVPAIMLPEISRDRVLSCACLQTSCVAWCICFPDHEPLVKSRSERQLQCIADLLIE